LSLQDRNDLQYSAFCFYQGQRSTTGGSLLAVQAGTASEAQEVSIPQPNPQSTITSGQQKGVASEHGHT
jgi:hypothetical protein